MPNAEVKTPMMERISQLATPKRTNTPSKKLLGPMETACGARETIFSVIQALADKEEAAAMHAEAEGATFAARRDSLSVEVGQDPPIVLDEATTILQCIAPSEQKLLSKQAAHPKLVPAPRQTIISAIIDKKSSTLAAANIPHAKPAEKKKFDLKASLATHRPLNYKPYTGPINQPKKDSAATAK